MSANNDMVEPVSIQVPLKDIEMMLGLVNFALQPRVLFRPGNMEEMENDASIATASNLLDVRAILENIIK